MLADAHSLAQQFADGTTDPVAALENALLRAERVPEAFITLCEERALREAAAAKARWQAGQPLSPFDGVPVAWKDLYDLAGCVTTAGAKVRLHDQPASRDCSLATMLSRAGMVSIGKTNLSELAYSGLGLNPHFGTPANISFVGEVRAPGGSSSGSAIAVAQGARLSVCRLIPLAPFECQQLSMDLWVTAAVPSVTRSKVSRPLQVPLIRLGRSPIAFVMPSLSITSC